MTQRFPNPNATGSLAGWSKGGSSTTLTSTAEGARWQGGSSGSGRYLHLKFSLNGSSSPCYLGGMIVRRNSGTAQLTRLQTDGSRWYDLAEPPFHNVGLSGSYGELALPYQLKDIYYPQGQFIRIPVGLVGTAGDTIGRLWDDAPENTLGFANDNSYDIVIRAEDNKPFDYTIRGVGIYDNGGSGAPANLPLDGRDCGFSWSGSDNTLTKRFTWVDPVHAIYELEWDWGHGGVKTTGRSVNAGVRSLNHTFPAPGIYTVKLTARDPAIGGAVSSTRSVTVPTGPLEAHYDAETDFLNVVVDATPSVAPSISPLDTFAWNWGDGTTTAASASKYASHSYTQSGTYNVTLTVKDNATNRTDTETKALVIVAPPSPDNYFVAVRELLTVAFTPSIQDGTSYAWTFGDGGVSSLMEPTHTYATAGTYSVTLTVNGSLTTTQDIAVQADYSPIGKLLEALRLEVSVPPAPGSSYNRVPNPSGELGGWGWVTPVTNSYLTGSTTSHQSADRGIVGAKLIYRSSGAGTQVVYSVAVDVSAGQYAAAQVQCPYVDGYYRVTVNAINAAGAVIGSSATTGFQQASASAVVRTTPYLLPAGTVKARIQLNHYSNTSSGTPAVNKLFQFRRAMLATAATSDALTSLPYADSTEWVDLIGPTSEIKVKRPPLDVGTLTATVLDSAYDPATSGLIRPGQRIRLRALAQDLLGNQQWQSIYTGKVRNADVTYNGAKGKANPGPKTTQITLNAVDALNTMAGTPEPRGVAKIAELPELLEASGVPFSVNGSTAQVPSANVVSYNANASMVDQVAITRDTDAGYAYVDREGVLQVREPAFMPTVAVTVIDEAVFSDVRAGFSTEDCINSVTIKWLRYTPAVGGAPPSVEEVFYGPYENTASIEEWGRRSATFTMQGVENPGAIAAKGAAILAANAIPTRIITGVTIPIRHSEDLSPARALLDLYDLTRLAYARTGTDKLARITSVEHTITPRKWRVDLGFSPDGVVASPQLTTPPPVQTTMGLPVSARRADTAQSITNATFTTLLAPVVDVQQGGITYSGGIYTVPRAGVYSVNARCGWLANATGVRFLYIKKGSSYLARFATAGAAQAHGSVGSLAVLCAQGDTISVEVYQTSGGALNTDWGAGGVGVSVAYMGA